MFLWVVLLLYTATANEWVLYSTDKMTDDYDFYSMIRVSLVNGRMSAWLVESPSVMRSCAVDIRFETKQYHYWYVFWMTPSSWG
jgi:hypothetical protein